MPRLPQAPYIRTTLALLAISFVLVVVAFSRAIRITPVEASENPATAALVRSTSVPAVPEIDLDAVGENDIFQPQRTAMQYRYRMPGESAPDDSPVAEAARPVVLGTVMSTDGAHFATCQLPGGRPTVVRVGDRLGDYTVTTIERARVVFRNTAGQLIEVSVNRPGT
jgi:type IV pilus biogenesis protein PilP